MNDITLPAVYLPGEDIVTTSFDGQYCSVDGSSFACGIMTGIVAIMVANDMSSEEIVEYFYNMNAEERKDIKVFRILNDILN